MNAVLWILQVVLAIVFFAHGWLLVSPPAEMVEMINGQLGVGLRMFIGVAELLAAVGLILPGVTRIMPWLTVWAAGGLMIVTASATALHLYRGEISNAVTTAVLFALLTLVTYMRSKVKPISSDKVAQAVR